MLELGRFRIRRTGHAGQLLVHAEEVLEGDARESLRLALDLDVFFRFDRLVQPIAPAAARHQASGELVDDDHLSFLHHVIAVALIQDVRAQRLLHVVVHLDVRRIVEIAGIQQLLDFENAFFGQRHGAMLLVYREIAGGVGLARLFAFDHLAAFEDTE